MVIVQADIDMTTKTEEKVAVDFWYSDVYEIVLYGGSVSLDDYAQMSEIFEGHVDFQPRAMVHKIAKNPTPA